MLIAVTDHAADRFRQRVRGTLEPKLEIVRRVTAAHQAGRVQSGERGAVRIRDLNARGLVYVCREEHDQLIVVTVYEEGDEAAVPRRFTDLLDRRELRSAEDALRKRHS